MSAQDEINTVVQAARQTETDGRRFYAEAAGKTANPLARRMFESLAAAEEEHLELINRLAEGEFSAPDYNFEFSRKLSTVFSEMPGDVKARADRTDEDVGALNVAIEMEDRSMAFYREWGEKASDAQVRKFCARMRAEEEDHWRILQSTLEYLENTGNWFMVQEGWSFDGG